MDHKRPLSLEQYEQKTAALLDLSADAFRQKFIVARCDLCWDERHCDGWICWRQPVTVNASLGEPGE